MMKLHNRQYLKNFRRNLRNNSTGAEGELWKYLKGGQQLGRKFRRQHSIGSYIIDFYCPSEKLAIELDGQVHQYSAAEQADMERDQTLNELGIKILRFENKDVFQQLDAVLQEISSNFGK
ncbi:endonuclease domain-containing protein [Pontibacter locisalis]|uniref:Endonuclease domain-containing protein n=1 Tax=Pontibacter locisalis TaxID=1719035 RepID=A0ABW5IF34_9BACT